MHFRQPERAIQSASEDALEREPFVRRLTSALIDEQTRKSTGVVVGVTGPWGSGKSSILNLLREHIKATYSDALVVSFDPWLISGRDDLIAAFMVEIGAAIRAEPKLKKAFKSIAKAVGKYGGQLAPAGNLVKPGFGIVLKAGAGLIAAAYSRKESLTEAKARLSKELEQVQAPIIVLIDELDRVEDREIRTIAQLVRSVADFRGISYVLAYDPVRVVQALGAEGAEETREERGRAYLEKIVQLQIPLPVTFSEELGLLFTVELDALRNEVGIPADFETSDRYTRLIRILMAHPIQTPRDIKRCIGAFHVLGGMLAREVDWIDLLAFCALQIKAPRTIDNIRRDPDTFAEDALSVSALQRRLNRGKLELSERLAEVVPPGENNEGTKELLGFLFPSFLERSDRQPSHADPLCLRRQLLTTLRLGLMPGDYSRASIESLVRQNPTEIQATLQRAFREDRLARLIDRLDDLYVSLKWTDHVAFWKGIAAFVRKPDCEWMTSFQPMHEIIYNFASILERAVVKDESMRDVAATVFTNLRNADEIELTTFWLRHQIFRHGLFGNNQQQPGGAFLNRDQTEAIALDMSKSFRPLHVAGKLIPCRWDLQPVYTMIDTGIWDDQCRTKLDEAIANERALDSFTLMLYGSNFTTDVEIVKKLCVYDSYIARVQIRLASPDIGQAHESVRVALGKAQGGGW
jgi:KAP-like P-loop domain-containing protein